MSPIGLIVFAAAAASAADHPRTYLASIVAIDLQAHESIDEFKIQTWGVEFKAICRIPGGWWIEAGGSATPEGSLNGRGSLGATWLGRDELPKLRNIALVTLYGPVQREDIRDTGGHIIIPATFSGYADVYGPPGRKIRVNYRNVQLTPANSCP